jgi:hypothetical protein
MKRPERVLNLWEAKPKRLVQSETTVEGAVTVLVPKFRNPFLVKWVLPHLARPFFRVKLDAVGSAIWNRCDGATPVSAIAEELKSTFGAAVEPVDDRIGSFLRQLERGDLMCVDAAEPTNHSV